MGKSLLSEDQSLHVVQCRAQDDGDAKDTTITTSKGKPSKGRILESVAFCWSVHMSTCCTQRAILE